MALSNKGRKGKGIPLGKEIHLQVTYVHEKVKGIHQNGFYLYIRNELLEIGMKSCIFNRIKHMDT